MILAPPRSALRPDANPGRGARRKVSERSTREKCRGRVSKRETGDGLCTGMVHELLQSCPKCRVWAFRPDHPTVWTKRTIHGASRPPLGKAPRRFCSATEYGRGFSQEAGCARSAILHPAVLRMGLTIGTEQSGGRVSRQRILELGRSRMTRQGKFGHGPPTSAAHTPQRLEGPIIPMQGRGDGLHQARASEQAGCA